MRRFVDSAYETADMPPEVLFYIDNDDAASIEELQRIKDGHALVSGVVGPRITMSTYWNVLAEHASGDILGVMGDDIVFRSPCWDTQIEVVYVQSPDRILMVHGRDGIHDGRFGTHCFVSREWYEACGKLFPDIYESEWVDTHLNDVANALGRRVFLENVFTEHLHYVNSKASYDNTYAERVARHGAQDTNRVYAENGATRERDIAILSELLVAS